jgi:type II secretory pathway pseudopilin PulG
MSKLYLSWQKSRKSSRGFTIAEILVCLLILGEIATFTIPKVITAQQNSRNNATAHEVASMIAAAYSLYIVQGNIIVSGTTNGVFAQYLNYISVDSTSLLDDAPSYNSVYNCSSSITCLKLHSGGTLFYNPNWNFGGTSTTNAIPFFYDPDGQRVGISADGPSKSVVFMLYTNGRLTSLGKAISGTAYSGGAIAGPDPSWFQW